MSEDVAVRVFEEEVAVATPEQIRNFVKELKDLTEKVKLAKDALKEAKEGFDELERIEEQMKELKAEKEAVMAGNPVLVAFMEELDSVVDDRKDLIASAKSNGVPQKEIDMAIKMLTRDIDPNKTTEIFTQIADLV